jgi:hypothetical protein
VSTEFDGSLYETLELMAHSDVFLGMHGAPCNLKDFTDMCYDLKYITLHICIGTTSYIDTVEGLGIASLRLIYYVYIYIYIYIYTYIYIFA